MVEFAPFTICVSTSQPLMNKPYSYRTPVICKLPDGDYSETEHRDFCRYRHSETIMQHLSELGFEDVRPLRTADTSPYAPDYTALRHNRRCCICMPEVATRVLRINHLSAEQCRECEQHFALDDVYFAALFVSCEQELKLMEPSRIRRGGAWITSEEAEQFLPFRMRRHISNFAPLLGGAHVFKLVRVILPFLMSMGGKARFRVTGISPDNQWQEPGPPYTVLLVETSHAIFNLLHAEKDERPRLVRPVFYHEEITHCEMELLTITRGGHECVVELMNEWGHTLRADCLDALVIPQYVPANRRYEWSLSLVAETCSPLPGNARLSTRQNATSPHAQLTGQILRLHELRVCDRPITVAEVRFIPESDQHCMSVYLAREVTDDYTPAVGDFIRCSGILRAAPRNVVEGVSWQDSPEIARLQHRRQMEMAALDTYMQYAAQHQKEAAVAAAFVQQGWQLAELHPREGRLILTSQQGGSISIAVCNGSNDAVAADYRCHVNFIPLPETGTHIARLQLTPPCPGAPDSIELPELPDGLAP